jgi:hypothetical protein
VAIEPAWMKLGGAVFVWKASQGACQAHEPACCPHSLPHAVPACSLGTQQENLTMNFSR